MPSPCRYLDANDRGLEFMYGDVRSMADCKAAVKGAEYVFHLAAMSKVLPSMKSVEMG